MIDGTQPASPSEVQLLLFEIGGERFGTDAAQVLQVSAPGPKALQVAGLGNTGRGRRALVFQPPGGDPAELRVDTVQGVKNVPVAMLRRLPKAAAGASYAIGVWLDEDVPVLLIDLMEVWRAHARQ